ncbi:MAG: TRAP transporter substrate-binding protein [Rhodospirillales bacterium]
MRNAIIGIVVGAVVGMVVGVTVVAPRLDNPPGGVGAATPDAVSGAPTPAPSLQLPPRPSAQPAVRLRMGSAYTGTTPLLGTLAKRVESEVWKVSAGTVEIRFHEPDSLVPVAAMFDAVASGTLDAAFASPRLWEEQIPALSLYGGIPFGPAAAEYLAWFDFGGGARLFEEIHHRHGVHAILCGVATAKAAGWFRERIGAASDLQGLRMRIDGLSAKVMARLGVEPVPLDGGAVFAALEAGEIDAVAHWMPAVDLRLGFQDHLKHYYLLGWRQPATLLTLIVNRSSWEGLTAPQRTQIEAVCGDNVRFGLAAGGSLQFAALKELYAGGIQFHRWSTEIHEALERAWREVVEEEAGTDTEFQRVWQSLKSFRAEYAIWQELSRP